MQVLKSKLLLVTAVRPNQVEFFDLQNGKWRDAPSLTVARSGALAVTLKGKLVVCGGRGSIEEGPLR